MAEDRGNGLDDNLKVVKIMKGISKKPGKQRKNRAVAALHSRQRMVACHLDRPLIREYNVRSVPVHKGDIVKILRGGEGSKGNEGKVANVDLGMIKISVENVTAAKADGTQKALFIDPSNCIITKLDLSDPRRKERLNRLKEGSK